MDKYFVKLALLLFVIMKNFSIEASSFSFSGEYIYFKPILDNTYYAIPTPSPTVIVGPRLSNQFEFSSGYRVKGSYQFWCEQVDVCFGWTSLKTSHQELLARTPNIEIVNFAAFGNHFINVEGNSRVSLNYSTWDALVGWRIWNDYVQSYLYLGLHHVKCFVRQMDTYIGTFLGPVNQRNDMWYTDSTGLGPEVLLFGSYWFPKMRFLPQINLQGHLQMGAVVIESDDNNETHVFNTAASAQVSVIRFINDKIQRVVPFWDLRLGIGTEVCVSSFSLDLNLGYEIIGYYELFHRVIAGTPATSQPTYDLYHDLFLHGLFVNIGLSY